MDLYVTILIWALTGFEWLKEGSVAGFFLFNTGMAFGFHKGA
jgi:hypothetical protein